jgi:hypothetical protein
VGRSRRALRSENATPTVLGAGDATMSLVARLLLHELAVSTWGL